MNEFIRHKTDVSDAIIGSSPAFGRKDKIESFSH